MVEAVERLIVAMAVAAQHECALYGHFELVIGVLVIFAHIAVDAYAVGLPAEGELDDAVVLAHRLVVFKLVYTQLLGPVVGIAELSLGDDYIIICQGSIDKVIADKLIEGIVEARGIAARSLGIVLLDLGVDYWHHLVPVGHHAAHDIELEAPTRLKQGVWLHEGRIAAVVVQRLVEPLAVPDVLVVLRVVLQLVGIVAVLGHAVGPGGDLQQVGEDARVVLQAQQARERRRGGHYHIVHDMDVAVLHLVVAVDDGREGVDAGDDAAGIIGYEVDGYVAVGHRLELQHTLLKVGALVGLDIAVVDDGVEHDHLSHRVAHGVDVIVLLIVDRVEEMLHGAVDRHEAGIVAAGGEHVIHGRALAHARAGLGEQGIVVAELRLTLDKVGGALTRKHEQV